MSTASSRRLRLPSALLRAGKPSLGVVTWAFAFELAEKARPGESATQPRGADLRPDRFLSLPGRQSQMLAAPRHRHHLHPAGTLKIVNALPAIAGGLAYRECTVVPQDHQPLVAKIGDQAFALAKVKGDAFVFMVSDEGQHDERMLAERQQALLRRRNRDPASA